MRPFVRVVLLIFAGPSGAPRTRPASSALEDIVAPTLVIAGEFENTGHPLHEERPERFANEVFRFVDALPVDCDT